MGKQEESLKKLIFDALQRGDLDIRDMPMTELKWLKGRVNIEIERQGECEMVMLIGVGGSHLYDKHFLEVDIDKAREYALKRAKGQLDKGRLLDVQMNYHKVHQSEVKQYTSMRGEYE